MFTSFKGFDLIDKYQKAKKAKKNNKKSNNAKLFKILFVVAVSLILWFLPSESFGIENLTAIEQRVIAIFAFAVLMWNVAFSTYQETFSSCQATSALPSDS